MILDLYLLHKSVVNEVKEIISIFFLSNLKSLKSAFFIMFNLSVELKR